MGRVQTFDSAVVVRAARDVFWDKGYESASVSDLEAATGINRSSLYHAFGSKRGLFDAAVNDYLLEVIRPRLQVLADPLPDGGALLAYFEGLSAAIAGLADDSPRRGCLLVGAATGLAGYDSSAREVVDEYRAELTGALRGALAAASVGAGAAEARLDARARTLASFSMSAMLLARVNRAESLAMLTTACEQIEAWSEAQPAVAETISSSAP
ncbi:helix-turn-helix domain-containing protein [Pengzhenrongella sp.]|jgi:AcrR family transcriptional regulator|uniref:TetR/AcrR family transcriptional regulator n=1 Tax=Pengzhenrongella sp. TaxID=2888820 RepID=UPI002F91E6B1